MTLFFRRFWPKNWSKI